MPVSSLEAGAALTLGGPDIGTLAEAKGVEEVTPEHVAAAEREAAEAAAQADEAERGAILGTASPGDAASTREAARLASLRAAVTRRKAERHQQAERLRGLAEAGKAALAHAGKLAELRQQTEADLKAISELEARIRDRIAAWNAGLHELADKTAQLAPEKPRPGMVPSPSSADVYAGGHGTAAVFVIKHQILTPIQDHSDSPLAAIDGAQRTTRQHDPSERLVIHPNGLIQPLGRDPGGHIQARIDKGEVRELSLAERKRYYDGEQVAFHG